MRTASFGFALTLAALSLGGCVGTYLDQKANLQVLAGREAAAQARLNTAQQQNATLNDDLVSLQRDVERNERKLAAAQSGLTDVNKNLAAKRSQNKISEANYRKLKADAEKLQREINELDMQMQGQPSADPSEVAARKQQIERLEQRKAELEKALKLATGS